MRQVMSLFVAAATVLTINVQVLARLAQAAEPVGIEKRVPWTTSKVRGTPDPPDPYKTEIVFRKLKFDEPLAMTDAPGTDRLFVVERYGRIYSFSNDPTTEKAELFLDLNQVLGRTSPKTIAAYGLAFHPQFAKNGLVYVTYVVDLAKDQPLGTRVSRFRVFQDDRLRCDPDSQQILIQWPSGGHNGGCLKFGPDGFLYVATGDASGIADGYLNGQNVSTLPGSILRIDVDHADPGRAYGIPKDNPFVDVAGARPEIWAYGLRQPWKMSFDRETGDLWTGNVGQDLWEMIFRIEKGGNYGWSVTEGSHPFRPERPRGPTPILSPVVEHDHAIFRSITGGFVYHGERLQELRGAYIYGDYDTGKIWMLRYDRKSNRVTEDRELVDSTLRLVAFGEERSGELYLLDHVSGRISRLVPNPAKASADFPRKLSETGLFTSTRDHTPAPGLIPYSVIAPQWVDGANKVRYLALPGNSQIEYEAITYPQPAPGASPGWKFPHGTVIAETIFLEMEQGNPASRRRLETRILHHERLAGSEEVGDQVWRGYTYLWNDQQTDAVLLEDPSGRDRTFTIRDPNAPGGQRQQTWHFPSRAECTVCHNMAAKYVLGLQTLQFNTDHDYGGIVANQLRTLEHLGIFTTPLPASPEALPRLVDYRDRSQPVNLRARSYLHTNCSHCHRKWGGGNATFQLLATLDVSETMTVGARPGQGTFNISHAQVIAPGNPYRSVLFYRMANIGPGHMPRIGSNVTDVAGVNLIHDWIRRLPGTGLTSASDEQANAEAAAALDRLSTSGAHSDDQIDRLLSLTSTALRLMHSVDQGSLSDQVRSEIIARATQHAEPHIRDLFERFLPEEKRIKRLGNVVRPEQILELRGDVQRGRIVFFKTAGIECRNCHRIQGEGKEVGPDLDEIGKKYDRAQILESLLEPSKKVEPKYLVYLVETTGGQIHTGLLMQKSDTAVVLKDAKNQLIRIPANEVELMVPQQKSLMPDLLVRDMTAQQVADLMAFLSSLKSASQPSP